MHAAACAEATGSSNGTTSPQRATAYGQRVRKTQPDGGASGEGSSPASALRAARASYAAPAAASTHGVLANRTRVYGWRGVANSSAHGAHSMTRPRYMTITSSAISSTTARLCEIKT